VFSRDGDPDDALLVTDGTRAAATAITMIASRTVLHAGDQLTVTNYTDEAAHD
jgi:hypothetical protein